MADFKAVIITKKGQSLMAKLMSGTGGVEFTRIAVSDSQYADSQLEGLTALGSIRQSAPVSRVRKTNDVAVEVQASVSNEQLVAGYYMRTLGLYAKDPDEGEVLYALCSAHTAGYMPPFNGKTTSGAFFRLTTTVGNASNLSLKVNPAAVATVGDIVDLQSQIDDMRSTIGYNADDIYGVEIDYVNRTFKRLAGAENRTPGKAFDGLIPWQRRRCILADDGTVLAYRGEAGYTETGATTTALTVNGVTYQAGTQAQVMVEQPRFYYRTVPLVTEKIDGYDGYHMRKARYYVSATPHAGFKIHPAFVADGKELDKVYMSAYEACLYDTSAKTYNLTDEQNGDFTASTGDKLSSVAKAKPVSGQTQNATIDAYRQTAHNRGTGWELDLIQTLSATQLLFIVEYASLNSQEAIADGRCHITDDTKSNLATLTGATASLGDASGSDSATGSVSYRGQENLWGDIYSVTDGLNAYSADGSGDWYVADHGFDSKKKDGQYTHVGFKMIGERDNKLGGYISAFGYDPDFDWLFLGTEFKGDSHLPVGDAIWVKGNLGWHAFGFGSGWLGDASTGLFKLNGSVDVAAHTRDFGARLTYRNTK